ncbi:hypothetical protein [Promicromonospora sp. NFX87]|uniref:hypothetical protein n=1 Tax=Promicromonospora sp. NFX87 TaxID=3402691 RepID=UPI003AFB2031
MIAAIVSLRPLRAASLCSGGGSMRNAFTALMAGRDHGAGGNEETWRAALLNKFLLERIKVARHAKGTLTGSILGRRSSRSPAEAAEPNVHRGRSGELLGMRLSASSPLYKGEY